MCLLRLVGHPQLIAAIPRATTLMLVGIPAITQRVGNGREYAREDFSHTFDFYFLAVFKTH